MKLNCSEYTEANKSCQPATSICNYKVVLLVYLLFFLIKTHCHMHNKAAMLIGEKISTQKYNIKTADVLKANKFDNNSRLN